MGALIHFDKKVMLIKHIIIYRFKGYLPIIHYDPPGTCTFTFWGKENWPFV